jgi:hypothetical protein
MEEIPGYDLCVCTQTITKTIIDTTNQRERECEVDGLVCSCPDQVALILSIRRSFSERISRHVRYSMNRCIDRRQTVPSDRLRPVDWLFSIAFYVEE